MSDRNQPSQHPPFVGIVGDGTWHRRGFTMKSCDARDQVACTAAAKGWQMFEPPMPRFFAAAVRDAGHGVVVDVGANTGFYTLLALAISGSVRIVAYEPLAEVRSILEANLDLNPDRARVEVRRHAISSTRGSGELFVPDAGHGLVQTSASLEAAFKDDVRQSETVEVSTLDELHQEPPRVAVLKIDAEGHDLEVLRGAAAMLRRDRPTVFVEVLLGADEKGLTEVLNRCGYRDRALRDEGPAEWGGDVRHHTDAWNHMWLPAESLPCTEAP